LERKAFKAEEKVFAAERLQQTLIEEVERRDTGAEKKDHEASKLRERIVELQMRLERTTGFDLTESARSRLERRCKELLARKHTMRLQMAPKDEQKKLLNLYREKDERVRHLEKELQQRAERMKLSALFEQRWYVAKLKSGREHAQDMNYTIQHLREVLEHADGIV
jgi:LAS superfamily LD-carboxypeptidase LdcB